MKKTTLRPQKGLRLACSDVISRITFSVSSGIVIEFLFAGMTIVQTLISRAIAQPIVMLTARPYGIYRDWGLRKARYKKGQRKKYVIVNLITYATFFCPQMMLKYWLIGATWRQNLIATASVALLSPVLGPLNGLLMDIFRKKVFKIPYEEVPTPTLPAEQETRR